MPTAEYVRKPIVFTAIQFDGNNPDEITAFCPHCKWDGTTMIWDEPGVPQTAVLKVGYWVMKNEVGAWMPYPSSDFLTFYTIAPADIKTRFLVAIE